MRSRFPRGHGRLELPNDPNGANYTNTARLLSKAVQYSCHSGHSGDSAVPALRGRLGPVCRHRDCSFGARVSPGEYMTVQHRIIRGAAAASLLFTAGACSQLGSILGGVGGGSPQSNQVSGYVEGVDTRSQQIAIQTQNGQRVMLLFDNQTAVVYQNQNYPVTALERGDQVTARIQSTSGGAYYTDLVQVDRSVSSTSGGASGNVQSLEGTDGQHDLANRALRLRGKN